MLYNPNRLSKTGHNTFNDKHFISSVVVNQPKLITFKWVQILSLAYQIYDWNREGEQKAPEPLLSEE